MKTALIKRHFILQAARELEKCKEEYFAFPDFEIHENGIDVIRPPKMPATGLYDMAEINRALAYAKSMPSALDGGEFKTISDDENGLLIEHHPQKDPVNHPSHYKSGRIEVIEAIEDWKLGFSLGNAVKYIARSGKKDPEYDIQDLEKAIWYVRRRIEILKAEKEGRPACKPNDMVKK